MVLCPGGQSNRCYVRGKVSGIVMDYTETRPLQVLSREESGCWYSFLPQPKTKKPDKLKIYKILLVSDNFRFSSQEVFKSAFG